MIEIMNLLPTGRRVALAGGAEPLRALARAADDLQHGRRTTHPELLLFERWGDLKDYAEHDPAGGDLAPLVEVVEQHGTRAILTAVDKLVPEQYADVTVSTAHKAKGREWPTVRISADFAPEDTGETDEDGHPVAAPIDPDEARLAYVAVTRARLHLDLGGLDFEDGHAMVVEPRQPVDS
jgi:ATP-dependent exoDNAse (exonuclease V) beta subunit